MSAPGFLILLLTTVASLAPAEVEAQPNFPLGPVATSGLTVAPYFEGWYRNPDGSYTLSFGYFNRNTEEILVIPRGPDNFIEPAEFDGLQPEHFPPRRVRGVFTVTVPREYAESDQRVTWTLVSNGETLSVPARTGVSAYELGYEPMAMGSLPPLLRFEGEGESDGSGPRGVLAESRHTTSVGRPLELRVQVRDVSRRVEGALVPINVTWVTHQGPAAATFSDLESPEEPGGGEARVTATFTQPGEYLLRAQADNFSARDSSSGDQCCWTNGYVRVTVTP